MLNPWFFVFSGKHLRFIFYIPEDTSSLYQKLHSSDGAWMGTMVQRLKRSILSEPMRPSDLGPCFQQQLSSWTSYKWPFSIFSQVLPLSGPPTNQDHLISSS